MYRFDFRLEESWQESCDIEASRFDFKLQDKEFGSYPYSVGQEEIETITKTPWLDKSSYMGDTTNFYDNFFNIEAILNHRTLGNRKQPLPELLVKFSEHDEPF